MAYDDGYYYGQCKIVAVVDNTADNGKTVLITTDDNKTYSSTIVNKKCKFLLPPRTLYTVQKVSSGSTEFTTKVEAGYGDCILVHLDTGYVEVKQGDIVGLDYIKAATDNNLKNKVPEAKAVKELNNSLTDFLSIIFGSENPALEEVTLPYTATDNCFMMILASNTVGNINQHYVLKSSILNDTIAGGNVLNMFDIRWIPIKKGDTISLHSSNVNILKCKILK